MREGVTVSADLMTIDGAQGEGGGQILRTALALAGITRTPVRIDNIRAGRAKPGLQRQHLMAVRAAARVCGGELVGDELHSRMVELRPQQVIAGDYRFDIGSAGSASLVLQTVLPALITANGPSTVVITGGTHNPLAPPFEFLRDAFLPLITRCGIDIDVELVRHGFYPAGGGELRARIHPLRVPRPLVLLDRGPLRSRQASCWVANLPLSIAEREAATVKHKLKWSDRECVAESIDGCAGPGNVVLITIAHKHVTEVFAQCGEMRVPAEQVAGRAAQEARRYLQGCVPVGEHLADQLLLPLALAAGGEFRTVRPSDHLTTNADVLGRFLGKLVELEEVATDNWLVRVRPP